MRRLRASESVRAMVAENVVLPENLILPVFLTEGGGNEPIASMPGVERLTVPALVEKCRALIALGVRVVFALDAEVDIRQDANIMKLRHYVRVEWVRNRDALLEPKDAPVDRGPAVFKKLYEERAVVR